MSSSDGISERTEDLAICLNLLRTGRTNTRSVQPENIFVDPHMDSEPKGKAWKSGALQRAAERFFSGIDSSLFGFDIKWDSFVRDESILEESTTPVPEAGSLNIGFEKRQLSCDKNLDTARNINGDTKVFRFSAPKSKSLFSSVSETNFEECVMHPEIPNDDASSLLHEKDKSGAPGTLNGQDHYPASSFKTATEQLAINDKLKGFKRSLPANGNVRVSGLRKIARTENNINDNDRKENTSDNSEDHSSNPEIEMLMKYENMKNVDPKMVEAVLNEVVEVATTDWEDIAGLNGVKNVIREVIIWPMLRPDIFVGLRGPPKGILLFGPPGTGKTMLGRMISTQSKSTFFNISASSLTSKWIGDGEKMVRALFQVALCKQPSVIFIDEIDSILTQRSESEHESSRRLKTEFLIQFDGCSTNADDRILVIGVTNRPQELDEAARRRFVKRIYIPLPDLEARKQLIKNLLSTQPNEMMEEDFDAVARLSEGFSGADIRNLCQEASYGPIRDIGHMLKDIGADKVRPILLKDFEHALKHVKSSVCDLDLINYEDWNEKFGCHL